MMWIKALKWLAFIAAALSIVYFVYNLGHGAGYNKAYAIAQKSNYERSREQLKAQDDLQRITTSKNKAIAKITSKYNKVLQDERQKNDSIIDNYKRGELRLRERLASRSMPRADCSGRNTQTPPPGLRDTDVEFLIRLSERADETAAQLTACQGVLRSAVQY